MSPAARLEALLALSQEIHAVARPADAVVSAFFRDRRAIPARDRGPIVQGLQSLLRHQARLGWWLDRLGAPATPRAAVLAWLALVEGRPPAAIGELFGGGRGSPAPLSEAERALLGALRGRTVEHPAMPEDVRLECPAWAAEPLRRRFGPAFAREMAACLAPAPLDLRVNPVKATRDAALRALRNLGLPAEPTRLAPHGIRLRERPALGDLPMLRSGEVEIQDEGSQLVALLLAARPGMRVVDFCAGAGGKTLALAADMANRGHVVACDVSEGRLKRAAERFRRAGLHNIETRLLASETDRWVKRHRGGFDRVLVDAPCSGTGTWRRNPDARWRTLGAGLETLVPQQGKILASAARLVKPGGRLVYATCSMLPEENEAQVAGFLAAHPGWRVVPVGQLGMAGVGSAHSEFLALTPARHGTDGFFAAVMEREGGGGVGHAS